MTCCQSNSSEKPFANVGVKNSQNSLIVIINRLMYMGEIKLFAKNEKEMKTLIKTIRLYS